MKKILISLIVIVTVLSIFCCVACTPQDKFEQVVKCAGKVRDMMECPDTFYISSDCGYQLGYEDNFNVYIAIQFYSETAQGEEIWDVAYFVNGSFVGFESNYDDGTYKQWSDSKQLSFLESSLIYIDGYYSEVYSKEEVNGALGIEVSGEADSGTEDGSGE